jgi:putative membrane protein
MRKIRSSPFLASTAAILAMTFAAPLVWAQSTTDKVASAVSDTADKGKAAVSEAADKTEDWAKGAPPETSAAAVLSRIHEVNDAEIYAGKLAMKKGSAAEVRSYGRELVRDHSKVDRKIEAMARAEGIELSPPGPMSAEMGRLRNHDGAVKEMLANVNGNTFDRDFLHAMVEDHQKNIDALKAVAAKSDDPKLKNLIQRLLPQLTDHQEMAEKLLERAKKRAS